MVLERHDPELERSTYRWFTAFSVLLLVFAAAFPVYRAVEPSRRAEARENRERELAAVGEQLYEGTCASCHGAEGAGGIGPAIGSAEFLSSTTDEQITALVAAGVPGTQMSAYSVDFGGSLTSTQISAVVAYLRSLADGAPSNPQWRQPLQGLTGGELYQVACAQCHGTDLEGGVGPRLGRGSDAAEDDDDEIIRRIRLGRDEMPSFANALTDDQIRSIVDFLREEQSKPRS